MAPPDDPRDLLAEGNAEALIRASRALAAQCEKAQAPADLALFEPRLSDRQGHFAILADQYLDLARRHGLRGAVFHHQRWSGESAENWSGLIPVTDHLVGTQLSATPRVIEAYSTYFHRVLKDSLQATGASVAVFPTARYLTLPAIARVIDELPGIRTAIIGVMETWPVPDCDDPALVKQTFQEAAQRLAQSGKRVQIFAESEVIARDMWSLGYSREAVLAAPYPAAARLAENRKNRSPADQPRFAALGASRPVHNPGLLAEYLLSDQRAPGAWTVRLNPGLAGKHLDQSPDELNRALRRLGVTVLPRHLDLRAYDETLQAADVMLLPYGTRYRTLGSGIFLECVCAGVIPLVPADSTMRGLYETLGGRAPAIDAMTPAGLAEAVDACIRQLPELKRNALAVRDAWLAHPQGPRQWERVVSELLENHRIV
jgi:hypothetical protein